MKLLLSTFSLLLTFSSYAQFYPGARGHRPAPRSHIIQKKEFNILVNKAYQGFSTIHLKQLLKQKYPYQQFAQKDLIAVKVLAKSQMGHGSISLRVGANLSYPKLAKSGPYGSYISNYSYTYGQLQFLSPSYNDGGVWQLDLKGNIKIKSITVVIKSIKLVRPAPRPFKRPVFKPSPRPAKKPVFKPAPKPGKKPGVKKPAPKPGKKPGVKKPSPRSGKKPATPSPRRIRK